MRKGDLLDSIYRGDSPPKKMTRVLIYQAVRSKLGWHQFTRGKYLVIPSKDAGDVGVLHSLGVPLRNIYGIDRDPHAIAASKYKYADANFTVGNFWDAFKLFPELSSLNFAFIDLCCPLRENIIANVLAVGSRCKLVGFEFLCGREQGALLQSLRKTGFEDTPGTRLKYLANYVGNGGRHFNVKKSWYYTSHSAAHHGKSMLACLGNVSTKRDTFNIGTPTVVTAQWKEIREHALKNYKLAPLRWNIPRDCLAAWLAHETRGTYD